MTLEQIIEETADMRNSDNCPDCGNPDVEWEVNKYYHELRMKCPCGYISCWWVYDEKLQTELELEER